MFFFYFTFSFFFFLFFFFNDTATTEIYTLSLHDALPIRAASRRRTLTAVEWKVPTHILSAPSPTSAPTRLRISRAALLVKVTASSRSGQTLRVAIRYAIRAVSTRVLPLPAPAKIRRGPSPCVTASCWGGFRRESKASTSGVSASSVGIGNRVYPALSKLTPHAP